MVIDCLEDVFQMMVPTFDAPEEEKVTAVAIVVISH